MSQSCSEKITPKKLEVVVKSAVNREDRSRNVVVFGLFEDENEIVDDEVDKLLYRLEYKASVRENRRVGLAKPGIDRPVRQSDA